MKKNSFILFTDMYESIKNLPVEEKASLLDAIFVYAKEGKEIPLGDAPKMAFSFIKRDMDRQYAKWRDTRKKRVEAGRLGGLKRAKNDDLNVANASDAKQSKQVQANQAVNVNVNANVNATNRENISSKKKLEFWNTHSVEVISKLEISCRHVIEEARTQYLSSGKLLTTGAIEGFLKVALKKLPQENCGSCAFERGFNGRA